jgi:hypothetical protein
MTNLPKNLYISILILLLVMGKITNAAGTILLVGALSGNAFSQRTLNWNFNVPTEEKIDSLHMKIFDSGFNQVFNDSIALYGTNNNIPTSNVSVGKSNFDVKTYSLGNRAKFNVTTSYDQDAQIDIIDLHGRVIGNYEKPLRFGVNEFDIDLSGYSASQYILRLKAKEGTANSRIVNVGGQKKVSSAKVNTLESMLKSAVSNDWMFVLSHPKLLTDTFYIAPDPFMNIDEDMYLREIINGQVLNVLEMVGNDGKRKMKDGRFIDEVGIYGMKVFFEKDIDNFAITDSGGYFSLRPDIQRGSVDSLFILNHLNDTMFYPTVRPLEIKSGEILDVNGKPSSLITFPKKVIEGLNYSGDPRTEDLLDGLWHATEIWRLNYWEYPQYNQTIVNMDFLKRPLKVYLDRENTQGKTFLDGGDFTAEQFSDTVLAGYKLFEQIPGIKFVETMDKDSADIETIIFQETDYEKDHYVHMKKDFEPPREDGWYMPKIWVYQLNSRRIQGAHGSSTHEITHAVTTGSDDGHSLFKNDVYGVRYELPYARFSEKDILITKLCVFPPRNPNYSFLRKETKYDNKSKTPP